MNNFCQSCDQLRPTSQGICDVCTEDYKVIREYIQQNPESNVMDISNSTKISLKKIRIFVEKGNFLSK
jgi:molybdenum cofactor biosynthesis enzyme MoaA